MSVSRCRLPGMGASNTTKRRCPCCGRMRKFVPSEHGFAEGREWGFLADGRRACYWCVARETPGGEAALRERQADLKLRKRLHKRLERRREGLPAPMRFVTLEELNMAVEAYKAALNTVVGANKAARE